MGQVLCVLCKARSSVWRRRVFCMFGVVVVIMVVDSNRVVRMYVFVESGYLRVLAEGGLWLKFKFRNYFWCLGFVVWRMPMKKLLKATLLTGT